MLTMLDLGKSDNDMEVIFVRFARLSENIANVTNLYCLQYIVHINSEVPILCPFANKPIIIPIIK